MTFVVAECLCFGCAWRVSMCSFASAFSVADAHFREQHKVDLPVLRQRIYGSPTYTQFIAFMGARAMVRFDLEGVAQFPYVVWNLSASDRRFLKALRIAAVDAPAPQSFFG